MADPKTKPHDGSVSAFLDGISDEQRRQDCWRLHDLMREVTGSEAVLWGPSIVGFGSYHYRYASGREGDWLLTGFSPRKQALTVYIMTGLDRHEDLMTRLGKFKTGKSCLYLKRLDDVDVDVLRALVEESVSHLRRTYG